MTDLLYYLIIYPLHQIIEFAYRVCYEIFHLSGLSIIGVSFVITLLCLPLYDIAEKWQQVERETQKKLKPGVDRIKSTFKGDEQYMILTTFYRENHYHPLMALRSSLGLLIQVPFFIAAYIFLSKTADLAGNEFLFINDFSRPDELFHIGDFPVNVLPIAMTIINVIAGTIYTKGFPVREKIQIYAMALVFMAVLYNSPSGMVLYWTMNNVFSLIKNIFYKLKNPLKVFRLMMAGLFFCTGIYILAAMKPYKAIPVFALAAAVYFSPWIKKTIEYLLSTIFSPLIEDRKLCFSLFFISALGMALLTGLVIPTQLLKAATAGDFAYIDGYSSPLYFVFVSALQCTGFFLLWPLTIYFMFNRKVRTVLAVFFSTFLICSVINAFCFQGDYGNISADLVFTEHKEIKPDLISALVNNFVILFSICLVLFLIWKNKFFLLQAASNILLIAFIASAAVNAAGIHKDFLKTRKPDLQTDSIEPVLKLSTTEKNVVVVMLDKAPGYFLPLTFEKCPELYEEFTGFTFYPNTVSFGSWTIQGAPGLYGGYEYTPWEMNHRREISMKEKHNQALSLVPEIFADNGFSSFLVDPPYPNYDERPVFSFLEGKKNITPLELTGRYSDLWYQSNSYEKKPIKSSRIKRNLMWFSFFKIAPLQLRSAVHYKDWWTNTVNIVESTSDFIDRLSVLDFLPELTEFTEGNGSLIFMDNESTHNPGFVSAEDARPIDKNFSELLDEKHPFGADPGFHAMTASFKRLGEWISCMKENNAYDNTKIIIVSDHGSYQLMPEFSSEFKTEKLPRTIEWFNPVLMVKDFGANGKLRTDSSFMTEADVPALAFSETIKNPVNPYTGKEIRLLSKAEKEDMAKISFSKANKVLSTENNGFIISDREWFSVKDNIFDINNWNQLEVQDGELKELK